MWLINAKTLELEDFKDDEDSSATPPYAVLSHTWSSDKNDELTFEQLLVGRRLEHDKLQSTRSLTLRHGLKYFWIDTCCIPAEPDEERLQAILTMYMWYHRSTLCFVHLADVKGHPRSLQGPGSDDEGPFPMKPFLRSRWFTRGWTLQELVAPETVKFFSRSWQYLGSKTQLADIISVITRIPRAILAGDQDLSTTSLQERIGWLCKRELKYESDRPYCLIGLCDLANPHLWHDPARAENLRNELMEILDSLNKPECVRASIRLLEQIPRQADWSYQSDENRSNREQPEAYDLSGHLAQVSLSTSQSQAAAASSTDVSSSWIWIQQYQMYCIHLPSESCFMLQNGVRIYSHTPAVQQSSSTSSVQSKRRGRHRRS